MRQNTSRELYNVIKLLSLRQNMIKRLNMVNKKELKKRTDDYLMYILKIYGLIMVSLLSSSAYAVMVFDVNSF